MVSCERSLSTSSSTNIHTQIILKQSGNIFIMPSLKRIIIVALLAVDGLFAFSVLMSGPTIQSVVGLLFLNGIVGGPAYAANYFLSRRSGASPHIESKPKSSEAHSLNLAGLFNAKSDKKQGTKTPTREPVATKKGEAVANTAEQRIADHLYDKQVAYDYLVMYRLPSGRRVRRSAFFLSEYSAFVMFRTKQSLPEGAEGLDSDEEQEWQKMRPSEQDLKFIVFKQKDLKNLEGSLSSVLAQLDSLRMPS